MISNSLVNKFRDGSNVTNIFTFDAAWMAFLKADSLGLRMGKLNRFFAASMPSPKALQV